MAGSAEGDSGRHCEQGNRTPLRGYFGPELPSKLKLYRLSHERAECCRYSFAGNNLHTLREKANETDLAHLVKLYEHFEKTERTFPRKTSRS